MRTVNEVSKITGVSVRTLHHYDAIGLLNPTKVTQAGYRLYDDTALSRLQSILLFRELQFPLKEIKAMLDSPDFNASEALTQQIKLLELKRKHIEELISFAREIQEKGVNTMDFNIFNNSEVERYKEEVKQKWGGTKAYQEYEQKEKAGHDFSRTANEMMTLFAELGTLKQRSPKDKIVQKKINNLQNFITNNYYNCTTDILNGLGNLYVDDERFKQNIDKVGGEGTAEFVKNSIEIYCSKS